MIKKFKRNENRTFSSEREGKSWVRIPKSQISPSPRFHVNGCQFHLISHRGRPGGRARNYNYHGALSVGRHNADERSAVAAPYADNVNLTFTIVFASALMEEKRVSQGPLLPTHQQKKKEKNPNWRSCKERSTWKLWQSRGAPCDSTTGYDIISSSSPSPTSPRWIVQARASPSLVLGF